jgi:hypothetical protein
MATIRQSKPRGPRTALGKNRSKYNARTHGIFSKVVVLDGESQAEFDAQLAGLCESFRPVGAFEDGLVEILAVTRWRQRRLLVAEAAEIEAGRTFIEWDEMERQMFELVDVPESRHSSGLVRKIGNVNVLDTFLIRLGSMRLKIESDGLNFERDRAVLAQLYGRLGNAHWQEDLPALYQRYAATADVPEEIRKREQLLSPDQCKKYLLESLEEELEKLRNYKTERISVLSKRMKLESLRRSVPDSPRLDQLLRYGTTLERTFDRTLSQLERAQRMRLGQQLLPRIDVSLSS